MSSVDVITGQVGNGRQGNADGTTSTLRQGKTGELVVGEVGHGRYFEAASRGKLFVAANQAGVTSQAGLSATTPVLSLYNPANSGVNAVILYAGYVMAVANAAANVVWLGLNTNPLAAAVTGSAAVARNALLGGATPTCSALLAATLPAAPVAGPILGIGLTGAITTVPSQNAQGRHLDGMIVVAPGCAVSFQTSTASGASGLLCELVWEEVPIA